MCPAGRQLATDGLSCVPCPSGTYSGGVSAVCVACPEGRQPTADGTRCVCLGGSAPVGGLCAI